MFNLQELFKKTETLPQAESDLSRLIKIREERAKSCQCSTCIDLLSRLHLDETLALHEHEVERFGLKFWATGHSEDYRNTDGSPVDDRIKGYDATSSAATIQALMDSECEWQNAEHTAGTNNEPDAFWFEHYNRVVLKPIQCGS